MNFNDEDIQQTSLLETVAAVFAKAALMFVLAVFGIPIVIAEYVLMIHY